MSNAVVPAKNLNYTADPRVRHTFVQDDALFVATHTEADAVAMMAEAEALKLEVVGMGRGFCVKVPRK